jgi:nucleotide-binding universal stress UspA family protein
MKILIPVDGSASADGAVDYVISYADQLKVVPEIFLLNVQLKLALGNVKLFINQETVNDYYREQGTAALEPARAKLDKAEFAYAYHISIGTPADAIVKYAQEHQVDQIVMSSHSQETLSNFLLGSVAAKVVQLAQIPVLLVQ